MRNSAASSQLSCYLILSTLLSYTKGLSSTVLRRSLTPNQKALADAPQFPRTWVPLASVFELDPDRPTPVQFLGQSYAVYRDNNDQWVVVDDACPHRLSPLSEGRVDRKANLLECAYHGWAFDSSGQCQRIPQVEDTALQAAQAQSRCHVRSYSVVVEKKTLFAWLWPEDPLSVAGVRQAHPEAIMEGFGEDTPTYTRDVPYGWDTLLENIVDPSHVPFAHHNLQGTREDAIPINMTRAAAVTEWGFDFSFDDRTLKLIRHSNCTFRAPFVIQYDGHYDKKDGPSKFELSAVMIPTKPGHSRIILYAGQGSKKKDDDTAVTTTKKKKKVPLFLRIMQILPTWLVHQFSNNFLDSDLALLYYQERERERRGGNVEDYYFIPAPIDRSVRALRQWVKKYAHIPGPLPTYNHRSELFDRWSQHSDHCRHCSHAANVMVPKWRKNTYRALCISILLAKFLVARLVAVGCLALLGVLSKIESSLKQGGFDHYKNH
jgi:phenylpropionate dioxygenase-like ring-hydroxylating dioxygenase large terminal subunit